MPTACLTMATIAALAGLCQKTSMADRKAPIAAEKPHKSVHHGITLSDPWYWLKDPAYPKIEDAEILAYLGAENSYFEGVMAPHKALTEKIFAELKGRLKKDDASVPVRDGGWLYHWRFAEGAEYRTHVRIPVEGGDEQLVLDEAARAEGFEYYALGALSVSPDGRLLAFSEDNSGAERYMLRILELATGELLEDEIPETIGRPQWSADAGTLFYTIVDENWHPYQVKAHHIGDQASADRVVYEEPDKGFFLGLGKTQSRQYIVIAAGDQVTSEVRVLSADKPDAEPTLVAARKTNHQYDLDHSGGQFYIRTNDCHVNFRVVTAPEATPDPPHWQELIRGSDQTYIRGVTAFKDFIAVPMRVNGLDQVRIRNHDGDSHDIALPEETYAAGLGDNREFDTGVLRLGYNSMVTPETVFDYHLTGRRLETRKVREIPSGYDAGKYKTERLWATARDGARVPVSIVYGKDFPKDGSGRVHLIGYGAYGYGYPPGFDSRRLSLLDRGFAVAIAHIRGGDEMGWQWYLDGKLEKRTNSFNDFIDVAKHLIAEGYASPGGISISGRSAGGELMGAVLNAAPELWRAAIVGVPFVDVLNTMLDDTLPLTPGEWPEWGNPIEDKAAFDLIRSYSPYDNISAQDYPAMMVTGGLNDPRVTYWEPAKWTAKLRTLKTDRNLLVLKTNMGAGHGGKTGRYGALYEDAEEFVFILNAFGAADEC